MLRASTRYLIVIVLLLVAVIATRVLSQPRSLPQPDPSPSPQPQSLPQPAPTLAPRPTRELPPVYVIDVEGWYQITRHERAVVSPYKFTIGDELAENIPRSLGVWQAQGTDLFIDPETRKWFDNPEAALMRNYQDGQGNSVILVIFGSKDEKSYHLFEHTPVTCVPGQGWKTTEEGLEPIAIGDSEIEVRRLVAEEGGQEQIVLWWYMWDNLERYPEDGLFSVRVHVYVADSESESLEAGKSFVRQLFPEVLSWRRF
jgi:EpsI family protein